MNNTGTKYVRIVKQTAFWREKKRSVYTMFKIFSTYICWINIQNVNNTGTKCVRIMKHTEFWRGKKGEYIACLKYLVPIFVELIYKMWIIHEPNTLELWNKLHFEEENGNYRPR